MEDNDHGWLWRRVEALFAYTEDILCRAHTTVASAHSTAALVYGEITTPERLFEALRLHDADHFYDLGSGRGCVH